METKSLGQIWADEMNGKVPAGTFKQACFDQAKAKQPPKTLPLDVCNLCERPLSDCDCYDY